MFFSIYLLYIRFYKSSWGSHVYRETCRAKNSLYHDHMNFHVGVNILNVYLIKFWHFLLWYNLNNCAPQNSHFLFSCNVLFLCCFFFGCLMGSLMFFFGVHNPQFGLLFTIPLVGCSQKEKPFHSVNVIKNSFFCAHYKMLFPESLFSETTLSPYMLPFQFGLHTTAEQVWGGRVYSL